MTTKFRLYPNKSQIMQIDSTLDCCRFVYNHMLSQNIKIYKRRGEHLSYIDMYNLLPTMKNYLPWLKKSDSKAIRFACKNLDNAYQKFFKHESEFPKYKSKRGKQSYTTEQPTVIKLSDKNICLPKLGWVKSRGIRKLPNNAKICNTTIIKDTDSKYYACVTYKYEKDVPVQPIKSVLGLDYKITGLYVDSNGFSPNKNKHFAEALQKLELEQQKLSHKVGSRKGEIKSKRYLKQLAKVNKVYRHIANQRKDFLHKQSTAITKRYDVICIEDISIKDMYAKYEDINNHVAKHNINHTISYDGWYMFIQMLDYKLRNQGKRLIKVDKEYPSSEICSKCGHKQDMPLKIRTYRCSECGTALDRDYNAAVNIKSEGLRLLTT